MTRRSSLFTRSKMIRYVKLLEKISLSGLVIGGALYYSQIKNIEDKEKEKFLSKYTTPTSTSTSTPTTATNSTPATEIASDSTQTK